MSRCPNCRIPIVNGVLFDSKRFCNGCFRLEIQGTDYGKLLEDGTGEASDDAFIDFPEGMEDLLRTSSTSPTAGHANDPGAIQCKLYDLDGTGMRLHLEPAVFPAASAERIYAL